jgi:hypothetical protein
MVCADQGANGAALNPPREVAGLEKSSRSPARLQPVPRPEDDKAKAWHRRGRGGSGLRPSQVPLSSAHESGQRVESAGLSPAEVPALVRDVLAAPGQPLDAAARGVLESRLGHDFSGVRVHADAKAAAAARAIHARAYTAGRNVVFGAGQYSPATVTGQNLLAHELTHVVQQQAAAPKSGLPPDSTSTAYAGAEPVTIQRQVATEGDKPAPATRGSDVAIHSEVRGNDIVLTESLVREGHQAKLVTVFNPLARTWKQRLFRRTAQSPEWTDVTAEALRETDLNPPGVEAGELSVEWNMPAARPGAAVTGAGEVLSEAVVSEIPPSLVIPYVKDSILVEHYEFTPPGEHPYQHWADMIGRRWSATGARKTSFWLNKVVSVASAGVAAGGEVTSAGQGASAIKAAAAAEARSFKAGVRALQSFDLAKPLATKEEMVQGVRELEAGLKSHLPGPPLNEATHQLTDLQRRALEENVRRVITKSIPAVREGGSSVSAIAAQIANPRFRFLSQVPAARAALIDALKSIGMKLPAGW